MKRDWTFGQRVGAGFAVMVALSVALGVVAIYALQAVVESKDAVIAGSAQNLVDGQRLDASVEWKTAASRGYLLTQGPQHLEQMGEARREFFAVLQRLRAGSTGEEARRLLGDIERLEAAHQEATDRAVAARRGAGGLEAAVRIVDDEVFPRRSALRTAVEGYVTHEEQRLERARQAASRTASLSVGLLSSMVALALLFASAVAILLTRALGQQVGSAVGQVQSSSAELQAAANQQATGARQQATAMTEINTTINELLATSRQIAESAQRVAAVAGETAAAARSGTSIVERATESIGGIRRQVDLIVAQMLDLGRKSQQIGSVVEIVGELAEQTNILAVNASIEAAGAGEAGRRFAVVADEIRKLADRVGSSMKDVRTLVEDVRGAVNTTVMTTEGGSKAVDAGTRQFTDVAAAFGQIAALVSTTTEVAREIELSTKQQASAVEQVNVAVANVAQTTKETEASAGQTLQTASQLTGLSRDLLRLIRPQAAA